VCDRRTLCVDMAEGILSYFLGAALVLIAWIWWKVGWAGKRSTVPGAASSDYVPPLPVPQVRTAKWDGESLPEALLFEGGGTKGVAYGGAMAGLEAAGLLRSIKSVAGTSAGSQTAALFAFGFSDSEINAIVRRAPWTELLDGSWGALRDLYRLWTQWGIYKGEFLQNWLDGEFAKKAGKKLCTFAQQYELTGIELRIGVCCVSTGKFELLDRHSHPDMPVCVATRASSSIPVAFCPVAWKGKMYVDGGVLGNLPMDAFPGKRTLALELLSNDESSNRHSTGELSNAPQSVGQFLGVIVGLLMNAAQEKHGRASRLDDNGVEVLEIIFPNNAKTLDTDMSDEMFNALLSAGHLAVDSYVGGKPVLPK